MSDETTVNSAINGRTILRAEVSDGKTYIRDAITNRIVFYIEGVIGGGVEVMTTAERTAIVPDEGQLIYDSNFDALYVGDGHTVGGIAVGTGGGGGGATPIIKSTISGNAATITLENGAGDVKFVGTNGTKIAAGRDGEVQIEATAFPNVLTLGDWTDELEDVYTPGDGNWTR